MGRDEKIFERTIMVRRKNKKDFKDKEQFDLDMIWQFHLTALSYQPWHPKYTPHAKASHPRQDLMREWWRLAKIVNSI